MRVEGEVTPRAENGFCWGVAAADGDWLASRSKNSILPDQSPQSSLRTDQRFENVSVSPSPSSGPLPFGPVADVREWPLGRDDRDDAGDPFGGASPDEPDRCSPALSRSSSDHDRIEASSESISKRFESARGVLKNEMRTLVINRRSTLFSVESFFSLRIASVRCSFRITAAPSDRP